MDASLVRFREPVVRVETRGELTFGQLVASLPNGEAANAEVALEVEAERFVSTFLDRLVG